MLRQVKHIIKGKRTIQFILIIRSLLSLLIFLILTAFLIGIVKIFLDFSHIFEQNIEVFVRQIIVDSVMLLALIEVLRIAMSYLHDGRVRIRYIVDTVLIVLLNEVVSIWFKGNLNFQTLIMLISLLLTLMVIRVLAIQFSPKEKQEGFD